MGKNLLVLLCLISCAFCEHKIFWETPSLKNCKVFSKKIFWISESRSAVIVGKSEESVQRCQLTFGVASDPEHEQARLRVEIDFMYIHDCGIEVQINESSESMFSQNQANQLMMKSNCNQKIPRVLYAQPKNFVRVWWYKQDKFLDAYNFRLNISMIDNLPVSGPAFSTLVITGLVMVFLVCLVGTLFFKYLSHVTQSWHERNVENAIDRALYLYNSQEPLPEEPDHVYLQPGRRGDGRQQARLRSREPEIAFVHRNGRVERFRPLVTTPSSSEQLIQPAAQCEASDGRSGGSRVHEPQRARSHLATSDRESGACGVSGINSSTHHKTSRKKRQDQDETSSLAGCELPPSYEEAIEMPVAVVGASDGNDMSPAAASADPDTANLEPDEGAKPPDEGQGDHPTHHEAASTLDIVDYMNVAIGGGSPARQSGLEQEALTESSSDAPLLPRDTDSSENISHSSNLGS
ncbi:hypothetical protein ElyMa_002228200 [Elysia marginata]|uniref:CUB domain-containing protein n=1 Tax=Elysia marginata TaxID=1093978 RepID=A0AAV4FWD5_9GAST|nr:hypothetical protein ElyMa_002228200 [Elysia marginata]